MLNGIDPILIFNFWKLTPEEEQSLAKIPIVSSIVSKIGLPPIPIYLSEKLTGLMIDSEDKSIEIQTDTETLPSGGDPVTNQKGISSTIKVTLVATKDSIGLTLLSALADFVLPKVTSKEYSITYLHGSIVVFGGLLNSFSIQQQSNDTRQTITFEITKSFKTQEPSKIPIVPRAGAPASVPIERIA